MTTTPALSPAVSDAQRRVWRVKQYTRRVRANYLTNPKD